GLITGLGRGGAERVLLILCRELRRRGVQCVVRALTPGGALEDEFRREGFDVGDLGLRGLGALGFPARLRACVDEAAPDLVHAHLFHASAAARLFIRGRPIISHVHVEERRVRGYMTVERLLAGRAAAQVCVSEAVAAHIVRKAGVGRDKIRVIRNAVELSRFRNLSAKSAAKERLGLPAAPLVGCVARLDRQKGIRFLLQAFARLREDRTYLALVGDGPLRPRLEAQAASLGVGDRVIFAGEVPDVAPWLAAFDLFALPSLWEGMPLALGEAMASGLPVVATAVSGTPEMVSDGATGLLVPPGDPDALAGALGRLLDDGELSARLGAGAAGWATSHLDPGRMADEVMEVYRDCTGRGL
ncbi:MAG TPA: glycosyltransferase family 1 protein, partial [Alphaproteobacteria bacterium]|nr:glycosyltransferase family 1 protein [Alphaproteobacteria bacterium]